MSFTSNLKRGVDLPIFEWLRPLPASTSVNSCMVADGVTGGRYIYQIPANAGGMQRYDTFSDSWGSMSSPLTAHTAIGGLTHNASQGYYGRVIDSVSSSVFRAAVPKGNRCVGRKIKIISGTGAGQTRTISAVAAPVVHETLVANNNSTQSITDGNKNMVRNAYRDYGIRIVGGGNTDFRKILYNSSTQIVWANNQLTAYGVRGCAGVLPYTTGNTPGSQTIAQVESTQVTVDAPWTVTPDNTSRFVIQSGVLWAANASTGRFAFQCYDILLDAWYQCNSPLSGYLAGTIAGEVSLSSINDKSTLLSETVSSASARTLVTSAVMIADQYANHLVRIVSGLGVGQERKIINNTASTLTIAENWEVNPDATSAFEIVCDYERVYLVTSGYSSLLEYDARHDIWSDRKTLQAGAVNNLCAVWKGYADTIGLSTLTSVGTLVTATSIAGHGLRDGELVTILGTNDSRYNAVDVAILTTGDTTFTYVATSTPGATTAVASSTQSATQLVDASKSWVTNELVGQVVSYQTTALASNTSYQTAYMHRVILSNTATTLTFDSTGTSPINGGTLYTIGDLRANGGIYAGRGTTGSSTSNLIAATAFPAANRYAGRRILIVDGATSVETTIASHTLTNITLGSGLAFTPSSSAFFTIFETPGFGPGCSLQSLFNTSVLQKGRYLFAPRGNASNHLLLYDITTNTFELAGQHPNAETFTLGTYAAYNGGDRVYIQRNDTGRIYYYNLNTNEIMAAGTVPFNMNSTQASPGNRMCVMHTEDDVPFLYLPRHSGSEFWKLLLWT